MLQQFGGKKRTTKSKSKTQRGGVMTINGKDYYDQEEIETMVSSAQQSMEQSASPASVATTEQPASLTSETTQQAQAGGKKRGRRSTKKGGDMGAGIITAGTLLLIQAAAKALLERQKGGKRKQKGGQVIQSTPAPFGGAESLVQSTLSGGSMCGVQQGGKKKQRSRRQRGGALDVSGDLAAAFGPLNGGQTAYDQAGAAMVQHAPFQITGGVSQEGGKKKQRSRRMRGGACALGMADLDAAFPASPLGAVPPTTPATLTALHPQTGGKKRSTRAKRQ